MYVQEGFGFPCGNAPLDPESLAIRCPSRCAPWIPHLTSRARRQRTSGREMYCYTGINLDGDFNNTAKLYATGDKCVPAPNARKTERLRAEVQAIVMVSGRKVETRGHNR